MKSRLLGLLILFSTVPFLSVAQLPDLDFENWNTIQLFESPDDLYTNNATAMLFGLQPIVTKVSGAQGSAARLETKSSIPAMLGNDITNQGVPFNSLPDSIHVTYRSNIQGTDTCRIIFVFRAGGNPIAGIQIAITGSQGSFVTAGYPVQGLPQTPDTMLMLAQSGSTTGTWFEIDQITFGNSVPQMANNSLDNWTMVEYEDPQGWTSPNIVSALYNQPHSVRQNATDVQSGSSSVEIENTVINFFGGPDTVGFLINTGVYLGGSNSGSPYGAQPEKFSFYYKYAPVGNDSAFVGVIFSKWNSTTGTADSLTGNILRLGAASNLTKVELPFNWTGLPQPDSVLIGLAPGDLDGETAQPGSVVIFDDLMFEFGVGISTPVPGFANNVHLYPNPAGEYLYIDLSRTELQAGHVVIRNILGQVMFEQSFNDTHSPIQVNLDDYRSGTYLYEIREGERTLNGKFIVR